MFLLHEAFGYGYKEIAEITGKSEPNCRQISAHARRHIDAGRPRFEASREQREEVARRAPALGVRFEPARVNGQPGAVTYDGQDRVINVFALDVADGKVQAIWSVVNPVKLQHLGPVSDVALRGARWSGGPPPG